MTSVEAQLTDIENTLKAAKSIQAISGSMVEFHVIESDSYTISDTGSNTELSFKFTFHPNNAATQSNLTELTAIQTGTFTSDSGTVVDLGTYSGAHDNGERDSSGNLVVRTGISHPAGATGKFTLTAWAVATGPVDGYFTCETTVA